MRNFEDLWESLATLPDALEAKAADAALLRELASLQRNRDGALSVDAQRTAQRLLATYRGTTAN